MAVPQPTDDRTPCPVCRAPIHPIAGRCKHCKADLAAQRSARPAAGVALPPLTAPTTPRQRVQTPIAVPVADVGGTNGTVTYAADEPSQPILPPRPTGRMGTATVSKRSAWKSWPVLVIMLATVAIVAAVVLMAFPPGGASADGGTGGGKHMLEPPPAPEHMDQNPLLPSAPHSQVTPPAPPRHTPDPLPPADPDTDPDPFAGLGGLGGGLGGRGGGTMKNPFSGSHSMGLMLAVVKHACDRMQQCGTADDTLRITCEMTLRSLPSTAAPTCPAAQRCLARVDAMDCSAKADDMGTVVGLMSQLQDCADAISC